jgi:hypothetical protein
MSKPLKEMTDEELARELETWEFRSSALADEMRRRVRLELEIRKGEGRRQHGIALRGHSDNDTYVAFDVTGTGPGVRSGGAETDTHTALRARPPGQSEGSTTTLIALRGHSDYGDGLPSLRFKSGDCGGGSEALIAFDARNGAETGDVTIAVQGGGDIRRGFSYNTLPLAFGGNNTAGPIDVATACNAHGGPHGRLDFESETFVASGGGKPGPGYPHAVAFDPTARQPEWSLDRPLKTDGPLAVLQYGAENYKKYTAGTLGAGDGGWRNDLDQGAFIPVAVASAMSVRRLTPRECARLQGFPDDWCAIEHRGKQAADGPMYRAYGNSMAVPVIGWVLSRVQQVAAASLEKAA